MSDNGIIRKRIAILCAQPEEYYQKGVLEGIKDKLFEADLDVCIFAMYQKFQETKAREIGESNIFNLININEFDGIILLADTIQTPGILRRIEDRLYSEYSKPVLFVDKDSDYYPSISLDHYDPIVRLTEHLIVDHGYKDIAFITGKQWHPYSRERLHAFTDTMEKHGLNVRPERIYYGDFWYASGETIGDELALFPDDLPEAIACANDYMAIGLCSSLTKHGIRVPEDVAVVGYDSVVEGQDSPQPITSIPLPAREYGEFCGESMLSLLKGGRIGRFKNSCELFKGSSCGCHNESVVPKVRLRPTWDTDVSARSFMMERNRILADMLSGADLESVMDSVQSYTFQIRPFDSFDLCLNSYWAEDTFKVGEALKTGYSDRMIDVLSCGREGEGEDRLDFLETFDTLEMLPKLHEPSDEPRCFIFTPVHFDDSSFGYAVLGLNGSLARLDHSYCMWLVSVMYGLESLRRLKVLLGTNKKIEASRYIDSLTGLYNYDGFLKHADPMIERSMQLHCYVSVMALDISGLNVINSAYGRKSGDKAIIKLAHILRDSVGEGAICARLGNDEFVIAQLTDESNGKILHDIRMRISEEVAKYNLPHDYDIVVVSGEKVGRCGSINELESLINLAVSIKNNNKVREQKVRLDSSLTPEQKKIAETVKNLLDENRFNYHYQPIVSAKTGEIFAFEALMRPDIDPYIGPAVVIEYAEHLGRIYDVERSTFYNVLREYENKKNLFNERKLFINCITGVTWTDEDTDIVAPKLKQYSDRIVLELTEQREADDEMLDKMKNQIRKLGIQSAIDDYGTGYSNVVNLLRYMPDYVKIDRMLLMGINDNPQKQHFVKEVAQFAHDNNFLVLAEGVETSDELKTCIELGADLLQGYYLGRPKAEIISEIDPEVREEIFRYNAYKNR